MTEPPHCRACGKKLRPVHSYEYRRVEDENGFHNECIVGELLGYGIDSAGYFCTRRCGFAYGTKMARKESSGAT